MMFALGIIVGAVVAVVGTIAVLALFLAHPEWWLPPFF